MPSFDIVSIFIVNEDPSCPSTTVENQVSFSSCSETYIVRISAQSNAAGPFSIYTGTTSGTPVFSAVSRTDLVAGQSLLLYNADQTDCATPTPTPTPTVTPTPTQSPVSPSPTPTPTVTPTTSVTPTVTPTPTITPSITPSVTPSVTPSLTPTMTPTVTPSITISVTPTQTVTPTPSITPSITPTTSVTPTMTPTPTLTPTTTITPTVTPSITPTTTITPSITPTITPSVTATITPTPTITPTVTPSEVLFSAYIFAEPNEGTDQTTLLDYATNNGALEWGSYWSVNTPPNNLSGNYSNDLNIYAHQPSFTAGTGNFVTPLTLSESISQITYLFNSIEVSTTDVNPNLVYFYSIWLPLSGIGGSMSTYQIDVGTTSGGNEINNDIPSVAPSTNTVDVFVTSGAAIPAGTYRVLWINPNLELPTSTPLTGSLYFTGAVKS